MDLGWIAGIGTGLLMIAFGALCVWAYSPKQRLRFEDAARLPFLADPPAERRGPRHE